MRYYFGEDAANGPHVNRLAVVGTHKQQLGCSVPSRHNVLGEHIRSVEIKASRQTKVAQGQIAVGIYE